MAIAAAIAGIVSGSFGAEGPEHIALGLEHVVEEQAASVGAMHLMNDPNWKQTFMNALAGGNTRFTVFLDNLVGRSGTIDASAYDKVMTSVLRNATARGGATDFEISQIYQAGRLGSVSFMEGGLYTVSHSILLLRSVKASGITTRIDLLFKPVRYMSVPAILDGIDVRLVDPASLTGEVAATLGPYGTKDKIFSLSSGGGAWVISGLLASHEDEGSDSDPSHFDVPRMVWQ